MIIQMLTNNPNKLINYSDGASCIVLLQDGVYAASALLTIKQNIKLCALTDDWHAAGLPANASVELINAEQWVGLCAQHSPVMTIQ